VRRLIINADDFGLTTGVNRAIIEAHTDGVVTSATMMANGRAFQDAITQAQHATGLSVGCHVVLVDGEPLLGGSAVKTLLSRNAENGAFRKGFAQFAISALRSQLDPEEIQAEATAQIRRLQGRGIAVSHFDTHKHTHMLPIILEPLLRAAQGCGVSAVRNPFAPIRPLAFAHLLRRPHLWTRYSEVRLLRGWSASFQRSVAGAGMVTTDGTFGIVATGALDETLFEAIAGCIPEGTWEFVCHPGYNDQDLASVGTRLRESRAQELKLLTSGAAHAALEKHGVQLISYRDLVSERTREN